MYTYYLGIKYLLSRPVNILSLLGVTLAVWALIVIVGIFTGFIRDIHLHIRGATSDLSFIHFGPQPRTDLEQISALIRHEKAASSFAPKLSSYGLLTVLGREEKPVPNAEINPIQKIDKDLAQVVGIDFASETKVTKIASWLAAVEDPKLRVDDPMHPFTCPTASGPEEIGILLGESRARQLELEKGMKMELNVFKVRKDETVATLEKVFVFIGAYSSSHYNFDKSIAFVNMTQMQDLMGQDVSDALRMQLYNEISVKLAPGSDLEKVKNELNAIVNNWISNGLIEHGRFATWKERHRNFLMNVEHQSQLMRIVLFVLVVVAAFLVFATLSNMVSEKTRDIGILSAMGASRGGILMIFSGCGLGIAVLGCLLGILFAWLTCTHLNDINLWLKVSFDIELFKVSVYGLKKIPYDINPRWLLTLSTITIGLTVLSSLVPGLRAARMDPVQALRYE